MAKSTFLQLCSVTAQECGVTTNDMTSVTNLVGLEARIAGWVAQADLETQSRWLNWDFMQVDDWYADTVSGTAAVAAPADIGAWDVESFYLDYTTANYSNLQTMDYRVWRNTLRNGVKTNGKPSFVVIKPDLSLILESPPDGVYRLSADYWMRPAKMVDETDTSPIPEEYERIIVARAKIYYAEFDAAGEILSGASVEYDDLLDKLEVKYLPDSIQRRLLGGEAITVRPE